MCFRDKQIVELEQAGKDRFGTVVEKRFVYHDQLKNAPPLFY
jgi:hypothetical protein